MRGPRHLGSPCWTRPGLAGRAGGQTTSSRFRTEGRRVRSLLAHPLQRALQTRPASPPAISPPLHSPPGLCPLPSAHRRPEGSSAQSLPRRKPLLGVARCGRGVCHCSELLPCGHVWAVTCPGGGAVSHQQPGHSAPGALSPGGRGPMIASQGLAASGLEPSNRPRPRKEPALKLQVRRESEASESKQAWDSWLRPGDSTRDPAPARPHPQRRQLASGLDSGRVLPDTDDGPSHSTEAVKKVEGPGPCASRLPPSKSGATTQPPSFSTWAT